MVSKKAKGLIRMVFQSNIKFFFWFFNTVHFFDFLFSSSPINWTFVFFGRSKISSENYETIFDAKVENYVTISPRRRDSRFKKQLVILHKFKVLKTKTAR